MKTMILSLALIALSPLSAFASYDKVEISAYALTALLRANPTVMSTDFADGSSQRLKVTDILAQSMLSTFDRNGEGSLTVNEVSCEAVTGANRAYDCVLVSFSSDRKITQDGSYVPAEGMTESATHIYFRVKAHGKSFRLIGKVEVQFAG
jgi:hypothetical protein